MAVNDYGFLTSKAFAAKIQNHMQLYNAHSLRTKKRI